jgi:hypothetical protein
MEPLQIASLEQKNPPFFGAAYQYPKKTSPARNICLPIKRETEKKSDKQGSFHRSCFEAHVNQATRRGTVHPRNRIQPDPKQKINREAIHSKRQPLDFFFGAGSSAATIA